MHRCINNLILQNALFKNTSSNSDRKNFRKKRDTDDTQFQNCKVFKAGLLGHFFHFLFSFFFQLLPNCQTHFNTRGTYGKHKILWNGLSTESFEDIMAYLELA